MKKTDVNALTHSLDLLKDTYNYNHWVYTFLRPYVLGRVLEVGSGIGNLSQFMLNTEEIVCLEPDNVYTERLQSLADVHRNVSVCCSTLENLLECIDVENRFDVVVCVNVLEHIEDDLSAVKIMGKALKPNGHLLLYVPALPCLHGPMDCSLGHFRRYKKATLRKLAFDTGLTLEKLHYVNIVGAVGWFVDGRMLRKSRIDPAKARIMDDLVPYISAIERLVKPPLGQSLFAVFRK